MEPLSEYHFGFGHLQGAHLCIMDCSLSGHSHQTEAASFDDNCKNSTVPQVPPIEIFGILTAVDQFGERFRQQRTAQTVHL